MGKTGITLQEFEALQAERLVEVKQQKTEESACRTVSCDRDALDSFQRYVGESLQYSCKRCGLLYGTWTAEEGGVEVDAVYEPAQDNTPLEINITETAEEIAQVDELAEKLGLQRVGWILFHPEREYVFSTNEVLLAATLQNEARAKAGEQLAKLQADLEKAWGPEKTEIHKQLPAAEAAAELGKRFVTLVAKPERDEASRQMLVRMEPYQMSDRCLELTAEGKFHQSHSDPSKAKVSKPLSFVVEKKEVQKMDLEFFLVNVALNHDYTSILASSFAQANRLDKPQVRCRGLDARCRAARDASVLAQASELQTYFDARARGDVTNMWSDFNLLTFAAKSGGLGECSANAAARCRVPADGGADALRSGGLCRGGEDGGQRGHRSSRRGRDAAGPGAAAAGGRGGRREAERHWQLRRRRVWRRRQLGGHGDGR